MSDMRFRREKTEPTLKDLKRREILDMGIKAAERAREVLAQNLAVQQSLLDDLSQERGLTDDL